MIGLVLVTHGRLADEFRAALEHVMGPQKQIEAVTIGADDSVEEALRTMKDHKVRRLPVIDGHDLIGIISQADLAKNVDEEEVGELVEAISAAS
jgi:CBS domain-containing protein